MEDKTKLIVFNVKEIFLIFIFVILIAITSFAFGVKLGRKYTFSTSGITPQDEHKVDKISLKSDVEENAEKIVHEFHEKNGKVDKIVEEEIDQTAAKLKEEFKKLDHQDSSHKKDDHQSTSGSEKDLHAEASNSHDMPINNNDETGHSKAAGHDSHQLQSEGHEAHGHLNESGEPELADNHGDTHENDVSDEGKMAGSENEGHGSNQSYLAKEENEHVFDSQKHEEVKQLKKSSTKEGHSSEPYNFSHLKNKWTIQLASFPLESEAKGYAEGLKVRGYSPIVYSATVPKIGKVYRVTLGAYSTSSDAKAFIKKEPSLFQGKDYVIIEVK